MGQVPDRKMGSLKQFSLVSMDACGHFTVKVLNTSMKVWVLVLACLQTKAVHLEIVEGLKTEEVINALERAVARRGNFEELHADNFASFVAAKSIITREQEAGLLQVQNTQGSTGMEVRLPQDPQPEAQTRGRAKAAKKRALEEDPKIDWEEVKSRTSRKVWKWTFLKPYSSEGNGVAEAMVKLAKEAMSTTFRHMDVRLNEFRTIVAKAEARVNSRPIAMFHPNDFWENTEVLTPQHFAVGMLGGEVAPEAAMEDCRNLPERWAIVQRHLNRWDKELQRTTAAMMLASHKWSTMVEEMRVGTLVLVMEENAKRYEWPLGLVMRVIRSQDGVVRAAAVRTKCGEGQTPTTLTKNVRELVPLTLFDQQKDCPEVTRKEPVTSLKEADKTAQVIPKKDVAGYGIKSTRVTRVKSLPTLKARQEWAQMVAKLKSGTRVLIRRKGVDRNDWTVGLVVTVLKQWGVTRAAAVRSLIGQDVKTLTRPVQELVPLTQEEVKTREQEALKLEEKTTNSEQKSFVEYVKHLCQSPTKINGTPTAQEVPREQDVEPVLTTSKRPGSEGEQSLVGDQKKLSQVTTNKETEIPDVENTNVAKTCQNTPDEGVEAKMESGNDKGVTRSTSGKTTTHELPDTETVKEVDPGEKKPNMGEKNKNRQGNDDGQADGGTEAPENAALEATKSDKKTPKRKYKTEVEKLKESQGGLEITTAKRDGRKVVSSDKSVKKNESIEALIEGDGPKTGRAQ
jgi:hypothetical protein